MSAYTRLSLLANKHGLRVARSDSDTLRIALVSYFEIIEGYALPMSIYPNSMQAFRALKEFHGHLHES